MEKSTWDDFKSRVILFILEVSGTAFCNKNSKHGNGKLLFTPPLDFKLF